MNDAYQLLMEKYMPKPLDSELDQLKKLFEQWSKGSNQTVLNHLFEIIESHESEQIRDLAIESISQHFPRKDIKTFVDLWITHPLPALHIFIYELIEAGSLSEPLISVIYLMLDEMDKLVALDPDFKHLDKYMNTLDPLLGSLVFGRYLLLTSATKKIRDIKSGLSIIDLIRLEDFEKLWENILEYPIPFLAELIHLLYEEKWMPIDQSDQELYGQLQELIGTRGWFEIKEVMNLVISKQQNNKFIPLDKKEIREKDFHLLLSPDLINRPDRIYNQDFIMRGNRNLVDPDLGLSIYHETNRKSDVDGMLHIPIYTNEGVEISEFTIPAPSTNHFTMDDDGLYFTIRNKKGLFSLDIDALSALLLPVSKHSAGVNEIISTMMENASGKSLMVMEGLNLLSNLHRGREFTLFDNKDVINIESLSKTNIGCNCILSLDLGNINTNISLISGSECDHEMEDWEIPTLIYYKSPNDYLVGDEVIENDLVNTSQTFRFIKDKLRFGNREYLRIHSSIITTQDAYLQYLIAIIQKIRKDISHKIDALAITYSTSMISGFDLWLRKQLKSLDFSSITIIDELSAAILNYYRVDNLRGNVLLINLGSSQSSAVLAQLPLPKSRKRTETTRIQEEPLQAPTIIVRDTISHGFMELNPILKEKYNIQSHEVDTVIKDAFNKFEDKLSLDDLNKIIETSDYFNNFQYLIRNVLVKGGYRGITKDDINTIILSGKPSDSDVFKSYISDIFEGKEIIFEKSSYIIATGAALLAKEQPIRSKLNHDYFLKISNRGAIGFTKILSRGEEVGNTEKSFEIRSKAWFDHIVIDLWSRKPKFINDENIIPFKDSEHPTMRGDNADKFSTIFLLRELLPFEENSRLIVRVLGNGLLEIDVRSEGFNKVLQTNLLVE